MVTPFPQPNTQPIYPRTIFRWKGQLTNQTAPFNRLSQSITQLPPLLLGTAGECGAIIFQCYYYTAPTGNPPGPYVFAFTQREGDNFLSPIGLLGPLPGQENSGTGVKNGEYGFRAILPNDQKALHLEANEKLFVAFDPSGYNAPTEVIAVGGHY